MSKKAIAILLIILLAVSAGGIYLYSRLSSPERVVQLAAEAVSDKGIDALEPYVTPEVWSMVSKVLSVVRSPLTQALAGSLLEDTDLSQVSAVLDRVSGMEWSLNDVMKSRKNASVILNFQYEKQLSGSIHVDLVKQDGKWLISSLSALRVDL